MKAYAMVAEYGMVEASPEPVRDLLVERLRRGTPTALAEAYDRHHTEVRAFARRLIGDESSEDLVHDVFMALPKVIHGFKGNSSLKTFLIGLAINHARHHVRAASRRRAAMEKLSLEPNGTPVTPEQALGKAALAQALAGALDELPLEQRVAFVLCEVEDRTAREAGEIVGAPEATIRTRLFHARQKLQASLKRRGFE